MKRTTLALDEEVLKRLKQRAHHEGRPMQAVANDLLRFGLTRGSSREEYELELRGWAAEPRAGVDLLDRDSLFDRMDRES